jgi:protein-S-isoprenylcysteine O-methyltransferase Ste14
VEEKNGEHPLGDAGQLVLLGLFLTVWAADSFFLRISTFLSDYIPIPVRLLISALLLAAAVYLFRSGHVVVNHGQRSTSLISTGAFRYVRHPLYLGSILGYLAFSVSTASLFSLVLLIPIVFFYDYIAGHEERLLTARFGEDYAAYMKHAGKWIPKI